MQKFLNLFVSVVFIVNSIPALAINDENKGRELAIKDLVEETRQKASDIENVRIEQEQRRILREKRAAAAEKIREVAIQIKLIEKQALSRGKDNMVDPALLAFMEVMIFTTMTAASAGIGGVAVAASIIEKNNLLLKLARGSAGVVLFVIAAYGLKHLFSYEAKLNGMSDFELQQELERKRLQFERAVRYYSTFEVPGIQP